jgi:hypothetical protein
MSDSRSLTLLGAVRQHWRSFIPAWLFPLFFLNGGQLAEQSGHTLLFFWVVAVPLFLWSGNRASKPWMKKQIRYWPMVFWSIIVPFTVWGLAVFSRLFYLN